MGAPTIGSNYNTFQPMCFTKVPQGFLLGVNGLDRGFFWDSLTTNVWILGIDAPGAAPTVATSTGGGATAGQYLCYYRYIDEYGNASSLSPVTIVTANDGDEFIWSGIQESGNTRVTAVELWRTQSDEAVTLYLITTLDLTTTSYVDTLSDIALTSKADNDPYDSMAFTINGRPNANRYTPPPNWKAVAVWFQDRCFYFTDIVYDQGTVNVTNGSTTVVGNGVDWSTTMQGRYLYVAGASKGYLISSVQSVPITIVSGGEGGGESNTVERVTIGGIPSNVSTPDLAGSPTGGYFTLTFNGQTTGHITLPTSASAIQTALAALSNIGSGNVSVAGSGLVYTVTFQGTLAGVQQPLMTGNGTNASGGTITVTEGTVGSGTGQDEVQYIGVKAQDNGFIVGGEFTLTFNGHTTAPIPYNTATDIVVLTALQLLPSIGPGNIEIFTQFEASTIRLWKIVYVNLLGKINVPQMTVDVNPNATSSGVQASPPPAIPIAITTVQGGSSITNETQTISLPYGVSGGTFTLTFNGATTAAINYNASAATIQSALNGLSTISSLGTVSVTGGVSGPWTVRFDGGGLAGTSQPLITGTGTLLTGTNILVENIGQGAPAGNNTQTLTVAPATGGTFTLTFNSQTTTPIAYNANAATIQAALEALSTIGTGNVTVTGGTGGVFTITFVGTLAGAPQALITGNGTSMIGVSNLNQLTLATVYADSTATLADYGIRPEPKERNRVYYSEANEPESVPDVNEFTIQHDQNVDDELVGGITFMGGMYLFKQNHLYRLYYVRQPQVDIAVHPVSYRGAFNHRCACIAETMMFLMDEWGPYSFDGSAAQPIGQSIQNYWRDSLIDFSQRKWFFCSASPEEQTVRFHVALTGDARCQHAFAYNYRLGTWHLEEYVGTVGHACQAPISGRSRLLYGSASDVIYLTSEGTLDGTLGSGRVTGSATTASSGATLIDTNASSFPADCIGASLGIVSGAAKGQIRRILSTASHTLNLNSAWSTAVAVGDQYQIGAIRFQYRMPSLRYLADEDSNRRELRIVYQPTISHTTLDVRRYYDHDTTPTIAPVFQGDLGWGLTWDASSPDQVLDMSKTQQSLGNAVGFTQVVDDGFVEDRSQSHRWVSYEMRGFQGADQVKLLGLELYGLEGG